MVNAPSKRLSIFAPAMYGGGAERSVLKLGGGIAARGYSVDLVLARAEGPLLAEVPNSVRLVDLKSSRDLTSLPALVRYLRNEQPAALLSVLHTNVIALWARRIAHVPTRIVVSERNMLSRKVQHFASDLRMRLLPRLSRYFYPWADHIVAVSEGVADDLSQVLKIQRERVRVIYNPIVTPELRVKAEAPLEHPWFEPGEPPLILAVGRLTTQKGFSTLIQAFAQVRRTHLIRLLILGEGEERHALEAEVKQLGLDQDVRLPGFVANPYPYMARASMFVLSSIWEGLPGVLIESLFCGALVISTDCPSGPREILQNGQYGQLVPVGDVESMAQAIENALAGKMSRPPKESWSPFELDVIVDQYIKILLGI